VDVSLLFVLTAPPQCSHLLFFPHLLLPLFLDQLHDSTPFKPYLVVLLLFDLSLFTVLLLILRKSTPLLFFLLFLAGLPLFLLAQSPLFLLLLRTTELGLGVLIVLLLHLLHFLKFLPFLQLQPPLALKLLLFQQEFVEHRTRRGFCTHPFLLLLLNVFAQHISALLFVLSRIFLKIAFLFFRLLLVLALLYSLVLKVFVVPMAQH